MKEILFKKIIFNYCQDISSYDIFYYLKILNKIKMLQLDKYEVIPYFTDLKDIFEHIMDVEEFEIYDNGDLKIHDGVRGCKNYNTIIDTLVKYSKLNSNLIFELDVEDELYIDNESHKIYFNNGKYQIEKINITFGEFNENKLLEYEE